MSQSPGLGYCEKVGHTRGILITWDNDDNIVDLDCEYKSCPHVHSCDLYKANPVGFHKVYPCKK